jgi:predicted ABC-class ATPase
VRLVNDFLDDADQVKRVFIMKSGVELPANAVSLDEYFSKKIKEAFEKNLTYFKVKQKASLYRSEMHNSQRLFELAAKLPADHIISVFARNSTEDMKSSNLKPSEQRKQQQLMSFLNGIGVDWANNNVFCVTANSEANAERKKVVNEIDAKYPMLSVVRENWTWNGENLDKTLQYILFVDKHS